MAKGNPHKMHDGYKRMHHKTTSGSLLFDAEMEMREIQRDLLYEEMDEDFDYEDFYSLNDLREDELPLQYDFDFWDTLHLEDFGSFCDDSYFLTH